MRIFLVRHGQVGDGDVGGKGSKAVDDADKELMPEGEEQVQALAEWMLRKNEIPAFIYSSPVLRAQQTAEILRDAFGIDKVVLDPTIASKMSIRGLLQKLANDDLVMRPLIVSHGECIGAGLKAIGDDAMKGFDVPAMGELRIIRVKRGDLSDWKEHRRVLPSDLGDFADKYSSNPAKS